MTNWNVAYVRNVQPEERRAVAILSQEAADGFAGWCNCGEPMHWVEEDACGWTPCCGECGPGPVAHATLGNWAEGHPMYACKIGGCTICM